ncbi:MAG: hypothetical protein AAF493_09680, partial [Pseudomonadota bacterium]
MNELSSGPDKKRRGRTALVFLFGLFFAPIVVSWVLLFAPEKFRPSGTTNRGNLIDPPRWISSHGVRDEDNNALGDGQFQDIWTMLLVQSSPCGDACKRALYNMRQSWTSLNKDQPRVQRVFVASEPHSSTVLDHVRQQHPRLQLGFANEAWLGLLGNEALLRQGIIVIVDPKGLALMYYHPDDDARGIIKDMKR